MRRERVGDSTSVDGGIMATRGLPGGLGDGGGDGPAMVTLFPFERPGK